jgi:hypothetical protein
MGEAFWRGTGKPEKTRETAEEPGDRRRTGRPEKNQGPEKNLETGEELGDRRRTRRPEKN